MPQTSKSKKSSATNPHPPAPDPAEAAQRTFDKAIRSGQRLQEETAQWWSRTWTQSLSPEDWQRRANSLGNLATEMMPLAQKRWEETLELMQRSGRTGTELLKKAAEASQTPGFANSQAKWIDFWTASLKAVQSNVEAMTELSTNAIDSWLAFVRKNTEVAEVRVPKSP